MSVIIGVVSTVVAAMIVSGSAWMVKKFKQENDTLGGVETFHVKDRADLKELPSGS